MSAFNILVADAICPACGRRRRFEIQFKYGNTWQLRYSVGDLLKWGGNDIGEPGYRKVLVEGAGGPCPACGAEHLDFDILVENDKIVGTAPASPETAESPKGFFVQEK